MILYITWLLTNKMEVFISTKVTKYNTPYKYEIHWLWFEMDLTFVSILTVEITEMYAQYLTTDSPLYNAISFHKSFTALLNGSQLAKMKKNIPDMSPPIYLKGWSSWSKKVQLYLKNYDFCEYVEFGAISWKFDILSMTV